MIRSALLTLVAALTALAVGVAAVGAAFCVLLWKDERPLRVALVAVVLLVGCAGSLPEPPASSPEYGTEIRWWSLQPMMPTTMHAYIYTMMEECSGARGDFWRIRWFSADFVQRADDYERLGGIWISAEQRPVIILDRRLVNDPLTVSHEELHDIIRGGAADHEDPRFTGCEIKRIIPVAPR